MIDRDIAAVACQAAAAGIISGSRVVGAAGGGDAGEDHLAVRGGKDRIVAAVSGDIDPP